MGFFFQVRDSASTYDNLNVNTSRTTNRVGLRDRSNKCDTERVICVSAAYRMVLFLMRTSQRFSLTVMSHPEVRTISIRVNVTIDIFVDSIEPIIS